MTDGISICCSFRTRKDSKKENNDNQNINIETEQIRKGLYDADNIICSSEYLNEFI